MLLVWIALGVFYIFLFGFTKELIRSTTTEARANLGAALWPFLYVALAGAALARWLTRVPKGSGGNE